MPFFRSRSVAQVPQGLRLGREQVHADHSGHRKLLLIRHGQTDFNVQHLLPGQLPGIPLNTEGIAEAQSTADALKLLPLTRIVASPLERTMQTAACVNVGRGLDIVQDRDLLDTDYGRFSGQNYDKLDAADPQWNRFTADARFSPKGVESFVQVQTRAVRASEHWRQLADGGNWIALVTHADLVKLIVAHYMGIPLGNIPLLNMDNASVTLLTFHPQIDRPPTLLCCNWTSPALWLNLAERS